MKFSLDSETCNTGQKQQNSIHTESSLMTMTTTSEDEMTDKTTLHNIVEQSILNGNVNTENLNIQKGIFTQITYNRWKCVFLHNSTIFHCSICDATCRSYQKLKQHRLLQHRAITFIDQFKPTCCELTFSTRNAAHHHMSKCSFIHKEINKETTLMKTCTTLDLVSPSQASRLAAVMEDTPNHDHMVRSSGCSVPTDDKIPPQSTTQSMIQVPVTRCLANVASSSSAQDVDLCAAPLSKSQKLPDKPTKKNIIRTKTHISSKKFITKCASNAASARLFNDSETYRSRKITKPRNSNSVNLSASIDTSLAAFDQEMDEEEFFL